MHESNFDELQRHIEQTLLKLKQTEDNKLRRDLLLEIRHLLSEADGLLLDHS